MKTRRQRLRRLLLRLALAYVLLCVLLVSCETKFVYMPFPGPATPLEAGLAGFQRDHFTAADGTNLPFWQHTEPNGPLILYFHGNGGGLYAHKQPLAYLANAGNAVAAMEYRGYPGAPGKPEETALVRDALAFYDHLHTQYPNRPIVVWGYSLGSGVATQLAAQRPVAALVLEAPFSAAVDIAKDRYPMFPVRWLMRNQFLSREAIAHVKAPVFIMHGESDTVIPMRFGEQLYARANSPKEFHHYLNAGHMDLANTPAYADALAFIKSILK